MKQDRNGVRTAQDLERKYDLSSLLGLKKAVMQNETGLTKIENELNNFTIATLSSVENLQEQIDGNITTYYYSGVPTLSNLPTSEWEESKYNIHLGDLYYDKDTGYAYRFYLDSETNEYGWLQIKDSDVVEALSLANSANDTADSKRRVFVAQPQPPYDSGDLWLKDQELYVCQISKQTGNYEDGDFIIATKYTDDTYAEQVNNTLTVFSGKVTKEISDTKARIDIVETATTTNGENISTLQTRATEIEANLEGVTSTVTEANNKYTQLSQRADLISAEVSKKADTTYVDKKLKQSDTVSGNLPLHYENSAGKDLIEFEVDGNNKQDTSTASANIFNDEFETGAINVSTGANETSSTSIRTKGYTLIEPNTEYIISNNNLGIAINVFEYDKDKNYIGRNNNAVISSGSSFTTSSNTKYIRLFRSNTTINNFQIQKGNVITTYEPFVPNSPSPDYPSEIEVVEGIENLFNGEFRTGNSANLNDNTRLFSTQVLYLKAGTYIATTNLDTTKYNFQHYTFSTVANPTAPVANILFTLGGWTTNKRCIINITEELEGYYYMLIKRLDGTVLTPDEMKEYQFMLSKVDGDYVPYGGNYLVVKNAGDNLFDKNKEANFSYSSNFEILSNGIKLIATSTNTYQYKIYVFDKTIKELGLLGKKISFSANIKVSGTNKGCILLARCNINNPNNNLKTLGLLEKTGQTTIQIPNEITDGQEFLCYILYANRIGTGVKAGDYVDYTDVMIEEGDTSTPYEEYKESISYIPLNKPNLFDGTSSNVNFLPRETGIQTFKLDSISTNFISVLTTPENWTYANITISNLKPNNKYSVNYDITQNDTNFSPTFDIQNNGLTDDSGLLTIRINLNNKSTTAGKNKRVTISNIYLYEGYEPNYFIGKINDEIKDRVYLQNNHAYLEKKIGKVVLDGSENWNLSSTTNNIYQYRTSINFLTNLKTNPDPFNILNNALSNYFLKISYANNKTKVGFTLSGNKEIVINSNKTSVNEFKSWLSEHFTEIYYELAEPQIIDLGEVSISTLKGTNNLYIESNLEPSNASIKYYLDTEFTEAFTTHEEMTNTIKQSITDTENSIKLEVKNEIKTTVKSITPYYAVSTSNTTAPTSGWSTTIPTRTTNQFIWRKDLITYQGGTNEYTEPCMITGDKGSTGSTGTGIESITAQFYLSNSKTSQTGGSWVTTMPAWEKGKYLWTRNKIVYKNPTSTTYTTPVCDSSYDAVNTVEAELELKVAKNDNDQIVSMLNASADLINLKGNRFVVDSTNFKVTKNGTLTCNDAVMNDIDVKGGNIELYDTGQDSDPSIVINNTKLSNSKSTLGSFGLDFTNALGYTLSITPLGTTHKANSTMYTDLNYYHLALVQGSSETLITAGGITTPSVTQTSLESQKKDFEKFTNALEEVEKTDIYKYHLKNEDDKSKKHLGFVIGDKYNYSKEITSTDDKGNDVGVDTYSMVSLCLQAIKELNTKVNLLESKIKELEGR